MKARVKATGEIIDGSAMVSFNGDDFYLNELEIIQDESSKEYDELDEIYCGNTSFIPDMVKYCEEVVIISAVLPILEVYHIKEDGGMFNWTDEMFEGLVEEEVDLIPKFGEYSDNEPLDIPTMTTEFVKERGLPCPEGYIFKDENGNVINATKIVLEKKKPKYPETYEECCWILEDVADCSLSCFACGLLNNLQRLLLCRDAYWEIAGEEMGLGKPWEYDCTSGYFTPAIICRNGYVQKASVQYRNAVFAFPTEKMRDAFYENFKELINECKELL